MPGRWGWSGGVGDSSEGGGQPVEQAQEQRRAARTVAAAATDLDDLRELLEMLGLDRAPRDPANVDHHGGPGPGRGAPGEEPDPAQ